MCKNEKTKQVLRLVSFALFVDRKQGFAFGKLRKILPGLFLLGLIKFIPAAILIFKT
jgi:hypothetical protein